MPGVDDDGVKEAPFGPGSRNRREGRRKTRRFILVGGILINEQVSRKHLDRFWMERDWAQGSQIEGGMSGHGRGGRARVGSVEVATGSSLALGRKLSADSLPGALAVVYKMTDSSLRDGAHQTGDQKGVLPLIKDAELVRLRLARELSRPTRRRGNFPYRGMLKCNGVEVDASLDRAGRVRWYGHLFDVFAAPIHRPRNFCFKT